MNIDALTEAVSDLDQSQLNVLVSIAKDMKRAKSDTQVLEWRVITPELFSTVRGILTRDEAVKQFELSTILRQFGTWTVTTHGVECIVYQKDIPFAQVNRSFWDTYIPDKGWVNRADFESALEYARDLWMNLNTKHQYRKRFSILKRDQYRCKLCGISALEGAKLEVDHKYPKSKGGGNEEENLWTLCQQCNQGKSDVGL